MVDSNTKKLEKLKDMMSMLNDSLSKEDFLQSFEKVLLYVKTIETKNGKEMEVMKDTIASAIESLKSRAELLETKSNTHIDGIKSDVDSAVSSLIDDCEAMMESHKKKMKQMEKRVSEVQDGQDADEAKITAEVIAEVKKTIPSIEDIENDLPKLGGSIRDALELLPEGEKMEIEAVQNLRKELDELKKKINKSTSSFSGGTVSRFDIYDLSSQTNGVLKTFNVPGLTKPYYIMGSDFPTVLFLGNGFTYSATNNTITLQTENAPSQGSQLGLMYSF